MKIYTNELSHITNMAALPIYGKNLKKIFSRTTRPKMFAFGLCTQVSDSRPHGPLVLLCHMIYMYIKGRFPEFRMYHNFANLFSKLLKNTFYKEISKRYSLICSRLAILRGIP